MKTFKKVLLPLLILLAITVTGHAQDCADYIKTSDCKTDVVPSFTYYSQSRSDVIKVGKSLKYNVVFYGGKEYMVSFCTWHNYYPLHFTLVDETSGRTLYDNERDDYVESVGFAVENTKMLVVEIELLAENATEKEIKRGYPCVGMLIQSKDIKWGFK
jgi:hypothetical protein